MDSTGRAALPTAGHTGPGGRRPCLLAWVFEREVALAHRAYWAGCRGPFSTVLAVLLYPLWLAAAVPLALLLGLLKLAILGAVLAAVAAGSLAAVRGLSPAPVPARRR